MGSFSISATDSSDASFSPVKYSCAFLCAVLKWTFTLCSGFFKYQRMPESDCNTAGLQYSRKASRKATAIQNWFCWGRFGNDPPGWNVFLHAVSCIATSIGLDSLPIISKRSHADSRCLKRIFITRRSDFSILVFITTLEISNLLLPLEVGMTNQQLVCPG